MEYLLYCIRTYLINTNMKINEAIQPSTKTLMETLGKDNTTGFLTEDLVKIHRQHLSGKWEPATYEEMISEIDTLMEIDGDNE